MHNLLIGEKSSENYKEFVSPIQSRYLVEKGCNYGTTEHTYSKPRRSTTLTGPQVDTPLIRSNTSHFTYIGSGF